MLITCLLWILILIISGALGIYVLSFVLNKEDELFEFEYFLYSQWIGILSLSLVLYVLSFFGSVSFYYLALIGFLSVILVIIKLPARKITLKLLSYIKLNFIKIITISPVVLITALYSSQIIFWGDTGGYHWSLVKWASEYGTVPGIGLLFDRFGLGSSWFSIQAAFNHGNLIGRVGSIVNGYILLLVSWHLIYCLARKRSLSKSFGIPEIYTCFGYLILLPLIFRWGMLVSSSPDIPVMILGVLVGCIYLNSRITNQSAAWITFLIALFAFNVKFSAAPLLLVAGLYLLFQVGISNIYKVIIIGIFGIAPMFIGNLILTGYPAFPSITVKFDLPWQVDIQTAKYVHRVVFDSAFYGPAIWPFPELHPKKFIDALINWGTSRYEFLTVILLLLNFLAIPYLFKLSRENSRVFLVVAVAFAGNIFFLLNAPTLRFGIQWLLMIPSLSAAYLASKYMYGGLSEKAPIYFGVLFCFILLGLIYMPPSNVHQMLLSAIYAKRIEVHGAPRFNFILPPAMTSIDIGGVIDGRATAVVSLKSVPMEDLDFKYNRSSVCWNEPLPCGNPKNIRLRDPEKGLLGGFINNK